MLSQSSSRLARPARFLAAVILTAVSIAGCSHQGDDDPNTLQAFEYSTAQIGDVSEKVQVSGTIAAGKNKDVSTNLTGPVEAITVLPGDRVKKGDVLATIDVSKEKSDLDEQNVSLGTAVDGAQDALVKSQEELANFRRIIAEGYDTKINSAQQAVVDADAAYDEAVRDFDRKKKHVETGTDTTIVAENNALDAARLKVLSSAVNVTAAGMGSAITAIDKKREKETLEQLKETLTTLKAKLAEEDAKDYSAPDMAEKQAAREALRQQVKDTEATIEKEENSGAAKVPLDEFTTHTSTAQQVIAFGESLRDLAQQQRTYEDALAQVSDELAEAQRKVGRAFTDKKNAHIELELAKRSNADRLKELQRAVTQAQRAADSARTTMDKTTNKLREDINNHDVTAPFDGVVLSVGAKTGAPASGPIVTLADDSSLMIRTDVSEIDVAKMAVGNRAEITTAPTGKKVFAGEVTTISPVAAGGGKEDAGVGMGTKPVFPVQITVTGDREGLRLGGSAKVTIFFKEAHDSLMISKDAVIEKPDGTKVVLVVDNDGTKSTGKVIEKTVVTGTAGDFDIAITGGELEAGDIVINQGNQNEQRVGSTVTLADFEQSVGLDESLDTSDTQPPASLKE